MLKTASIVVAHAPIGSGHRIAAEAIAAELTSLAGDAVDVRTTDILSLGRVRPSVESLTGAFTGPTAGLYDSLWFSRSWGRLARRLSTPALAWAYRRFIDALIEARPDAVVCTHALPALLAAHAVKRGRLSTKVVSVTTDFGIHGFWPREGVALTCVAHDTVARELTTRGFESEAVAVTGIPVRGQFTLDYDRSAARSHFGLPNDARILLALAGSTVAGPYVHFKESLATSLPTLAAMTGSAAVIVTGQDKPFAAELKSRAMGFGVSNVHIMGFVENMAPLMAACDLAIAKPGGLVSAECLAMGLPLLLVGPAVGQERANANTLTDAGVAVFTGDPRTLAERARTVLTNPARLGAMRAAAEQLARPFAATDVAERVLSLIGRAPASGDA